MDDGNGDHAIGSIDGHDSLGIPVGNIGLRVLLDHLAELLNLLVNSVALDIRCNLTEVVQSKRLARLGVQEPVALDTTML